MAVNFADPKIKRILEILREKDGCLISQSYIAKAFNVDMDTALEIFVEIVMEDRAKPREEEEVKKRETPLPFKTYIVCSYSWMHGPLQKEFAHREGVEVLHDEFAHALESHPDIDCIVGPANRYKSWSRFLEHFGEESSSLFEERGEQACPKEGSNGVFVDDIKGTKYRLIRTHINNRAPVGSTTLCDCMSLSLKTALDIGVKSVLFFDFYMGVWPVFEEAIARVMRRGYDRDFALLEGKEAK